MKSVHTIVSTLPIPLKISVLMLSTVELDLWGRSHGEICR